MVDESVVKRLEDLREIIEGTLRQWLHTAKEIAAGSIGERELANQETGPGGRWGPVPVQTAYAMASIKLFAATDYLRALTTFLQPDNGIILAPSLLTRACLEACCFLWWLTEPNVGARERVRRYLIEESFNVEAQLNVALKHVEGGGEQEAVDFCSSRVEAVKAYVATRGFTESPKALRNARPSFTDLTEAVFKTFDEDRGKALYGMHAAISHSTSFGVLQFFTEAGRSEEGPLWVPELKLEQVESSVQVAVAAFIAAFDRAVALFGWDPWAWEHWKEYVTEVFNSPRAAIPFRSYLDAERGIRGI